MWKTIFSYFNDPFMYIQAFVVILFPVYFAKLFSKSKYPQATHNNSVALEKESFFSKDLHSNVSQILSFVNHSSDIKSRYFNLGKTNIQAALLYLDGLSDKVLINEHILKTAMSDFTNKDITESGMTNSSFLIKSVLTVTDITELDSRIEALTELLKGNTLMFIEGSTIVLMIGTKKVAARNVEEPGSELLIKGPKLGFNEHLGNNITLLRQFGEQRQLVLKSSIIGTRIRKELVIAYIHDIANPNLVKEVETRLQSISMDSILGSGYIEQLIEDNVYSPFPQIQNTERPDKVISALEEGRIAIILDGTPDVMILPATIDMFIQSPDDYYMRWLPGSLFRLLRYLSAFISVFGPALYIAFISYHQGLIPTKLAISIAGARSGVPFPSIIEALLMEITIEILREAGLRLPKSIGQTIGIVGGLVIGEAAVRAGIVSPFMVIVVSITAIANFAIPQYTLGVSLRILRFGAMFFASILGLFGLTLFSTLLLVHLVKLKSFNVPYLSPAVSYRFSDLKDLLIRSPLIFMKKRPKMMNPKDILKND